MWRGLLMSASPIQPPEQGAAAAARATVDPQLLVDQFLPRYDLAVAHAHVFRVPPAECFRAASEVDLFQAHWFGHCSTFGDCRSVWWAP